MSSKFIKKSYLRSRSGPLFTQNDPPERKKRVLRLRCLCRELPGPLHPDGGGCRGVPLPRGPGRRLHRLRALRAHLPDAPPRARTHAVGGVGRTEQRYGHPHRQFVGRHLPAPGPPHAPQGRSRLRRRLRIRYVREGDNPAPQRHMRGGTRGTRQIQIRTKRYVRNLPGGSPRP